MTGSGMSKGFTLIELLVVLLLVGLLASLAAPVVTGSIDQAKESTLKENLYLIRKSIDGYYADKGHYPAKLDDLVENKYLRHIPTDPMTERNDTWTVVVSDTFGEESGIIDVHSGSKLKTAEGVPYETW